MAFADLNQALQQKQIDAMCQSEPQSSQAINKGWGVEIIKPYDTGAGRAGARAGDDRKRCTTSARRGRSVHEAVRRGDPDVRREPAARRKYVRETLFKGQITPQDYQDAMSNAAFTYDITVDHVKITTDMMIKYGVAR